MANRLIRLLFAPALLLALACGGSDSGANGGGGAAAGPGGGASSPATSSTKGKTVVLMQTSLGDITIELDGDKAPVSVANFLQYVDDGFYDGTVFHRVVPNFVIQGGGMDKSGHQKKTRDPIKNEADNGLNNDRGTLSMARTSDVNSATSQFFISLKDNDFLNHGSRDFGYAVFGRVSEGMDVVDKIAAAGANANVEITSAKRQ